MVVVRPFVMVCALIGLFGCGGGEDEGGGGGGNAACAEAANHSDLPFLQTAIFTPGCAKFGACHKGGATQARGLNLEAADDKTFLAKLTVTSAMVRDDFPGVAEMKIVEPGDPDRSYLMVLLEGQPAELIKEDPDGPVTMPLGAPLLCQEKTDAVRRWITSLPRIPR